MNIFTGDVFQMMIVLNYLWRLLLWHCLYCCQYAVGCVNCLHIFDQIWDAPLDGRIWHASHEVRTHWTLKKCPGTYSRKVALTTPLEIDPGTHDIRECCYVGCAREHFLWNSPSKETPFSSSLHTQVHPINCNHFFG